jgi:hypothetical protein
MTLMLAAGPAAAAGREVEGEEDEAMAPFVALQQPHGP